MLKKLKSAILPTVNLFTSYFDILDTYYEVAIQNKWLLNTFFPEHN